MATLKCKYCGGNVSAFPGNALGICSRCGTTVTLPADDSQHRAAAHNCGNYLRRAGKFDQAMAQYQKLLQEDDTDAEAHWCSALCRFGVQYVLETEDGAYVPRVTRPGNGKFLESGEYLAALANSGGAVQLQYEKEAAKIADCLGEEAPSVDPSLLLKQGFWHLNQQEWPEADRCFQQVLSIQQKNGMAHLGLLLSEYHCQNPRALAACNQEIDKSPHYRGAMEAGDENQRKFLESCARSIHQKTAQEQSEAAYQKARKAMNAAASGETYRQAARLFGQLNGYKDSQANAKECLRRAEILRKEAVYQAALAAKNQGENQQAAELFSKIPGWRDANIQAVECRQRADAQQAAKPRQEPKAPIWRKIVAAVFLLALLSLGAYLTVTNYVIPQQKYNAALALWDMGNRAEAIEAFRQLGSFKDSPQQVVSIQTEWYAEAEQFLSAGNKVRAAAAFGWLEDFQDARERSRALWEEIVPPQTISAGGWFSAALRSDRTAVAMGDNREEQCWVGSWLNIRSVTTGWEHTLGLRTDGTVVAAGYNADGRGNVESWRDMAAVSAGQWHTVGLKTNGTVIGLGCNKDGRLDFEGWENIQNISAGRNHTLGLTAAGTALAVGSNQDGQCDVAGWSQLSALSAGGQHSLGLKIDGTVVAAGSNAEGQCAVSDWEDVVAISAGYYHSVGLRADGTVVAVGLNSDGQCDVESWTDIVAVSAGGWHTLGLKSDGSIVAAGRNINAQCEVFGWDNMMTPG